MNFKSIIKNTIIRSGAFKLVYKYRGPSVTILRYHSVQDDPVAYESTIGSSIIHSTDQFRAHMKLVSRYYNPVSMDDVLSHLEDGAPLPPYPVVVTFDDGYKDNLTVAAPILDEFNVPATFYIIVDAVNNQKNESPWFVRIRKAFSATEKPAWLDDAGKEHSLAGGECRLEARKVAMAYCALTTGEEQLRRVEAIELALGVPNFKSGTDMMLSWDEIRELREHGHIIGSHTMSHPNMAYVSEEEASFEMEQSRLDLENELGEPVKHFAYPNPILSPNWKKSTLVQSRNTGYETAVTCDHGCLKVGDDRMAIKRMFVPENADELRWCIERTMNGYEL